MVLDCCVVLAWCFEDEKNAQADALLERLATTEFFVPHLWHLEVANVLLVSERRKRSTQQHTDRWLEFLRSLPIITDTGTPEFAAADTLKLARTHALSAYDAAYLELALRMDIPLATIDKNLLKAAKAAGVLSVLEPSA